MSMFRSTCLMPAVSDHFKAPFVALSRAARRSVTSFSSKRNTRPGPPGACAMASNDMVAAVEYRDQKSKSA